MTLTTYNWNSEKINLAESELAKIKQLLAEKGVKL
jgi:hypothetical protein